MDSGITAIFSKQLLYRLLFIQCGIRDHALHKKKHEYRLTTAIGQIIESIPSIKTHGKVIIHLCAEVVFNIIYSYSVNTRHYRFLPKW